MKRFTLFLITIILVFMMLPVSSIAFSAEESPVWDGKAAAEFAGGTGTAEDPYIIQTAQQLAFFSRSVSLGTSSYENEYIKLANNIVLNDTSDWERWDTTAPVNKWTPIGSEMFGFRGTFDGNGFTISGIYCLASDHRGLFGYVYTGATVANVGVVNSYIKGASDVGGVVGYAVSCTVSNCYYTGTVTGNRAVGGVVGYLNGGTVSGCYNTGAVRVVAVDGNNDGIGGVVGYAISSPAQPASVINSCYNTGTITGTGNQTGGVAGSAISCAITNCCNTGVISGNKIIGGIAGYANNCAISRCCNMSAVSGTGEYVGGMAGWAVSCPIDNCYNTGMIKGDENVGGIAGDAASYGSVSGSIKNCYNIGTVNGNKKVGGIAGWVLGIKGWFSTGTVSNCYYLKQTAVGGINSTDVSSRAIALTDTQLKLKETYTGWDIVGVWEFGGDPGYEYPTLIGVEHRKPGDSVSAADTDAKTGPSGGNRILVILIICFVVAGFLAFYLFYSFKKASEKE